jgi:hypothetical protein
VSVKFRAMPSNQFSSSTSLGCESAWPRARSRKRAWNNKPPPRRGGPSTRISACGEDQQDHPAQPHVPRTAVQLDIAIVRKIPVRPHAPGFAKAVAPLADVTGQDQRGRLVTFRLGDDIHPEDLFGTSLDPKTVAFLVQQGEERRRGGP